MSSSATMRNTTFGVTPPAAFAMRISPVALDSCSGPGSAHVMATSATAANTDEVMRMCSCSGTPSAIAPAAMPPPVTAPSDHSACIELMIERPLRSCTRRAFAFCATSLMASMAPAARKAAPRSSTDGADAAARIPAASSALVIAATRADPNRLMSVAAATPASIAPTGFMASTTP